MSLKLPVPGVVVAVLSISLAALSVTGCGSSFQGSLSGRDGNGQGPSPSPGQAVINTVSPSTATAGSAGFTLTVTGSNFQPTTVVLWNDTTNLATTYVSSTTLTAQVPASLIARPDSVSIDPSPYGTFNFGAILTVNPQPLAGNSSLAVSKVDLATNDMEWDPVSQRLYLSVASGSGTDANSVTALDPISGALGTTVATMAEAGKLATSSDGAYLYAGLNALGSIQRYTLPALQPDIQIPLGADPLGPYYAIDVQPEPGSPRAVAVSRGVLGKGPVDLGGVVIYDDATARVQSVSGANSALSPIDGLAWSADGHSLYGVDNEGGYDISLMSVDATGVKLQSQIAHGLSLFGNDLHADSVTGYLYTDSGEAIAPATQTVVGTYPLLALQGGTSLNQIMVPDGKLNIAYFLGRTTSATAAGSYVLEAFDLTRFVFLGAVPITGVTGTPVKMVRWGSNGLAILTGESNGTAIAGDGVYLVSGGFVTSPAP
jgi:hypothetical protein